MTVSNGKHIWIVLMVGTLLLASCRTAKNRSIQNEEKIAGKEIDTTVKIYLEDSQNDLYNASVTAFKMMTTKDYYEKAYSEIKSMLESEEDLNFKRAVFVVENAYFKNNIDYNSFNAEIKTLTEICSMWMKVNPLRDYEYSDSIKVHTNAAIFKLIKDTVYLSKNLVAYPSFQYDFEDFSGEKNWTNQFVTKLLYSGSGNCHSLPYLYKILANELNTEAYLSLAPNHIYLKHRNKWLGWYNTELTSGQFPTDAWVKASGYITLDAIRSGIYMDTLGQKESVSLCAYDLAKGYEMQTGNYLDGFILKCCDLALKYHPTNISAIILKAETLKKQYTYLIEIEKNEEPLKIFNEMQALYVSGVKLGYREMPVEMYLAWLNSAKEGNKKFVNEEINRIFQNR